MANSKRIARLRVKTTTSSGMELKHASPRGPSDAPAIRALRVEVGTDAQIQRSQDISSPLTQPDSDLATEPITSRRRSVGPAATAD
jgi:hypothetical protein